jgi:hypothetical protein
VGVQPRPIHRRITCAAMPGGVTAASMTEAGDMPDEDLIWAERVPVRASSSGPPVRGTVEVPLVIHSISAAFKHGDDRILQFRP